MTQRLRTQLLYLALLLYAAAALTYWGVTANSLESQYWHAYRWSHVPFQVDEDSLRVTAVEPAARAAGIGIGDTLESLSGAPYSGLSQWRAIEGTLPAGSTLSVTVRKPGGREVHVPVSLEARQSDEPSRMSSWLAMLGIMIVVPLISLVVGLWVAAARPREANAWLLLVLLSFPEVFFLNPQALSGAWLAFGALWFQTLQMLGFTALFLFGVYFPERWRLDRKAPWLKYVVPAVSLIGLAFVYWVQYDELFHPVWGALIARLSPALKYVLGGNNLLCLLLYWVAIFDKLRSASTSDSRRRMGVLCAGSLLGLGGVLVFLELLPAFGYAGHRWAQETGGLLFLFYPLALAYVVLVQRAMDVRILLRMGTKYALARATITGVRLVLAWWIIDEVLLRRLRKPTLGIWDLAFAGICVFWLVRIFTSKGRLTGHLQAWIDRRFFRETYDAEQVLSELSDQVRRITEPDSLVKVVTRRISEVLHVPEVALLLDGGGKAFELHGANSAGPVRLRSSSYTVRNLRRASAPVTLYRDNPDGWYLLADDEERSTLDHLHTEVLLPVPGRDRLMGIMSLSAKRSEAPYTPSDLRLLQNVATQAGLSLEISELGRSLALEAAERERFHREIEIAREVQERLFPQVIPQVRGASLAGFCRPAQGVGGDYYDLIPFDDGRLGIAVGDVSGKGISAALLMASLRASLRGMTMDGPGNLQRVMDKVNRLVYEASALNRYATFFFAAYDPETRELRYVNAGHNAPFVVRYLSRGAPAGELVSAGGGAPDIAEVSATRPSAPANLDCEPVTQCVLRLETGGPVVGLIPQATYEEGQLWLEPGDLLLAYTDGISEAMSTTEEEWGEERMLAAACNGTGRDAREILRCVFDGADSFASGAPQFDDMTLVVLKLEDPDLG